MTLPARLLGANHVLTSRLAVIRRRVRGFSLAHRFAVFCLVVLVAGALIIGTWVGREIERGVIERTSAMTALYVDSFVEPRLSGLGEGEISGADLQALGTLLTETPLGRKIVSFKVWSADGQVVFARDPALVGQRFSISGGLATALSGDVSSRLSGLDSLENRFERQQWSRLVETYSPVRTADGEIVGAVEFYQLPQELLSQVRESQQRSWLIVGISTIAMYFLLVGLVTGASRTIARQNKGLQDAFEEQKALQIRIRSLNQRLRRAAASKTQIDEELLKRLAQDLHDGPAQDLSLALLRIEALERPEAPTEEQSTLATIRFALTHALDEVRGLSTDLRLPQLGGLSWASVVEKAVTEHQRRTGALVHVQADDIAPEPSPSQRIVTYRVVQEALSNASRHSGADEQWVTLSTRDGLCMISIQDRGRGFEIGREKPSSDRRARLGLQGMQERIELLGGSVSVDSSRGRGTTIVARLPLDSGGVP